MGLSRPYSQELEAEVAAVIMPEQDWRFSLVVRIAFLFWQGKSDRRRLKEYTSGS